MKMPPNDIDRRISEAQNLAAQRDREFRDIQGSITVDPAIQKGKQQQAQTARIQLDRLMQEKLKKAG